MTEPKKAEVTLATKHVHGGREYDRGDVLTLREDQAAWLIAKQVAVKTTGFAATRELELDGWL